MKTKHSITTLFGLLMLAISGCATAPLPPVDVTSSAPGTTVSLKGTPQRLTGTPIRVGSPIPATVLVDAHTMKRVDLAQLKGKVLFLSIVPSLDTKVCEAQTHYLADKGRAMPPDVLRIVVSRDTPFAQKRFAEEAKLTGLTYLSDYRDGSFGRSIGMLQEESMLLARGVVLVDRDGIVRYIQVVPELTHLPDMEGAFAKARELAK